MTAHNYAIDRYVLDTLMADLVGHDHRPSSFLVYLAITAAHADGRASFSHAQLADARASRGAPSKTPSRC